MSDNRTPLQQLITSNRDLDEAAVENASDDLLRAAVIQSIDALQRLTDLAELIGTLDEEWGMPATFTSKFDSMLEEHRPTDSIDGGLPGATYDISIRPGKAISLSDASRDELLASLSNLHTNLRRYEKVSQFLFDSATAAIRGEYVQSEFDKAEFRQVQEQSSAPASAPRP